MAESRASLQTGGARWLDGVTASTFVAAPGGSTRTSSKSPQARSDPETGGPRQHSHRPIRAPRFDSHALSEEAPDPPFGLVIHPWAIETLSLSHPDVDPLH